jgi:glucosamine kinase
MERVLGIDGGGSKTDVVVVDRSGTVLARSRTGGLDPTKGAAWEAVLAGIAGEVGPVARAALGLPFHGEIADISSRQTKVADQLFGPGTIVANDVELAFEGALAGAEGVLILAGTGSMTWARGPLGTHRVGGWGDVFGDEGSAFWIGREALGRLSQELDGRRPRTGFAGGMLAALGTDADGLIPWTYGLQNPRAGIAALAAKVSALAEAGDPEAKGLMAAAAGHLADLGHAAGRLAGVQAPWSFAGGVMEDPTVRTVLTERMGQPPAPPVLPPVGGAALAAAKALGWVIDTDFIARLQAGLSK